MTIMRDPKTGVGAAVNDEGEQIIKAVVEPESEHASLTGNTYVWHAPHRDIDATDTQLYVRNDSEIPLHMDRALIVGSVASFTEWTIHIGESSATPAGGVVITGVPMNETFSSKAADATARTDETAEADGSIIGFTNILASEHDDYNLTGTILGKNHFIQINIEDETVDGAVSLYGHYEGT